MLYASNLDDKPQDESLSTSSSVRERSSFSQLELSTHAEDINKAAAAAAHALGLSDDHSSSSSSSAHHHHHHHGGGIPVLGSLTDNIASKGSHLGGGNLADGKRNDFSRRASAAVEAKKRTFQMNATKFKANATVEDIDILRKQVKKGGHTVIIVCEDFDELDQQTIWEQLIVIVKCLIFAKDNTPLVVVHAISALPSRCRFMQKYQYQLEQVKISYCVGDVLDPTTLQAAGCHTCARILTLAPSAPTFEKANFDGTELVIRSDDKKDESNILLMLVLEEYRSVWKRSDIHIIFDW
jgi:hypothetical protein